MTPVTSQEQATSGLLELVGLMSGEGWKCDQGTTVKEVLKDVGPVYVVRL